MQYLLEHVGTAVSAISGALAARGKQVDLFGVVVLALVTALGGGTLRDVILNAYPVFWVGDSAILRVEALHESSDTITLDRVFDSNTLRVTVTTTRDGVSYVIVEALRPGPMRLSLGGGARSRARAQRRAP